MDYRNDLLCDMHCGGCLGPGVDLGRHTTGQPVRVAGGNVVLIEDCQSLTEPGHDLQRLRKLYQGVTENYPFTATVAERLDRFLADLLALKAHLRVEPCA